MVVVSRTWRHYLRTVFVLSMLTACGNSSGCSGCDEQGQSAAPFPNKDKVHSAVQVRITEPGVEFLEQNLEPILADALPEEGLSFCLPGDGGDILGLDWGYCDAEMCPEGGSGCNIGIAIEGVQLEARPPNQIRAIVRFAELGVRLPVFAEGIVSCTLSVQGPGFEVGVPLTLSTPEPTRELTFAIADAPEYQLSQLDIDLEGNGGAFGWACDGIGGLINLPFIGDFILDSIQGLVDGLLLDQIGGLLEGFTCRPCEEDRTCAIAAEGAVCADGVCRNADDSCVTAPLGVEGLLDLGSLLSGFSPGLQAEMAYHAVPGSYVAVENGGISLGLISGAISDRNRCVPNIPQPEVYEPMRTNLLRGNIDLAEQEYEVGLGVTQEIVGHFAWAAFNSGLLCLEITTDTVDQLNASTIGIALPNLDELARNRNAPIGITMSPQAAPRIRFGSNTFVDDGEGNMVLEDPLLVIQLDELWLDFHVFMDDRWVRIFSLHTDVAIPFGVQFDADNGLIPVLGDIADGLGNIRTANGEVMRDSPQLIAGLLPVILNVFVGDLASSLSDPIALPDIMGFSLDLQDGAIRGIEENTMLGVFARLRRVEAEGDAPGGGAMFAVDTFATLDEVYVPPTEAFAIQGPETWRQPYARLLLDATDGTTEDAAMEYSWKVGPGTWTAFSPAREVIVRHPLFALQGKHLVQVRARRVDDYRTLDPEPAELVVIIDSEAPELTLRAEGDAYHVEVDDRISGVEGTHVEVRRDGGAWRVLDGDRLTIDGATESVEVRATDEAGNVTTEQIGVHRANLIGRPQPGAAAPDGGCDCAATGGPAGSNGGAGWLLAGLLLLGFRRRRATLTALLIAAIGLVGLVGCEDDAKPGTDNGDGGLNDMSVRVQCDEDRPCGEGEACEDGRCIAVTCAADPSACDALDCGSRASLCQDGMCVCEPFCANGCAEGEFCCELRNACEMPSEAECAPIDCPAGFETAVVDPGDMDPATCERVGVQCDCVEGEPLDAGFVGRFVDLSVVDGTAWISAYAEDYGDLVVARYDDVAGWVWQWVDGVPDGEIVAAPSGPRGGIDDEGPDVGEYSTIAAAADGTLHVAYRDVDNAALKYARGTPGAGGAHAWTIMTLDTDDAGRWAAISLDADGVPGIAYRVGSVPEGEGAVSELRWIMASTAAPEAPADWEAPLVVHRRALADPDPETGGYPEGTGLFNTVARGPDGRPVVAWYDRSEGRLWWSRMVDAGFTEPEMLAGWGHPDPDRDGDMGANVDLFIDGEGQAHLCYQDGMTDSLRYLAPGLDRDEWVDDGVWLDTGDRPYAVHVVGDDCNVRVDGTGAPVIVFQDATLQALLMRRRTREIVDPAVENPWAGREVLRGDEANYQGAHGFYAAAEVVGQEIWVVHYVLNNQVRPPVRRVELVKERL